MYNLFIMVFYKEKIFMKKYLTPKIELITYSEADILTASESIDFKSQWLENLGI